ncbi:MAG: class I tRNA ligase family protein, partial [Anaerolineales bacterium]
HKAFRDMGITRGPEPMLQLRNQGQILGPDGQRMSKSRGNVVDPDEEVARHGADAVRAYLMFGYRWSDGGPWNSDNIQGVVRWLNRVWNLLPVAGEGKPAEGSDAAELRRAQHRTIRQVTRDLEAFEFNTVVSALMELTNALTVARERGLAGTPVFRQALEDLLRLMAPVAPHIAEELWSRLGMPDSVHAQRWPAFDPAQLKTEQITLVVQVNGKVRDRIEVSADIDEAEARRRALESPAVLRQLGGAAPRHIVYVPGRLINVVI